MHRYTQDYMYNCNLFNLNFLSSYAVHSKSPLQKLRRHILNQKCLQAFKTQHRKFIFSHYGYYILR